MTTQIPYEQWIVAQFSITVTVVGTVFNALTLFILCRTSFRETSARPVIHYMRAMAVFDTLMLYGWNIDHYLKPIHGFTLQTLNIPMCRFLSFLNYFAAQASAWFRVFVSLDRYLALSRLHRTWFGKSQNVLIVIFCVILITTLINGLFFVVGCSINSNGSISVLSWAFQIYPTWDYLNLVFYNCLPFLLMMIFNCGVIYHLIKLRQTSTLATSRIDHRSISVTLLTTTFLFLLMTIPVTVAFAFFFWIDVAILRALDGLLYSYHVLSFPLYLLTFDEFRNQFLILIRIRRNDRRIGPSMLHSKTIGTVSRVIP